MAIPVSAVIITLNEERNIARCIQSLKDVADEILVIDSGSSDKTAEICSDLNVRFVTKEWKGYAAQKNYGNALAKHDCILSIDADEALSEPLKKSISEVKKGEIIPTCSFNRCTNYTGVWIRHGAWYPDVKIRIFNRKSVQWAGDIHERLTGYSMDAVLHLKGDLLHFSYYSEEEHIRQTEAFSSLSAQALFREGKQAGTLKLFLGPITRFFTDYVLRLGFLDGKAGFKVAKISARSTRLKYQKLKQLYLSMHD